jgi:hypothetical protein
MAAIAIAGVGLMVVCSSSLAAVMMMGGEEEDKTGTVCTPEGTPDPNATYKYGANDACVMTCKTGYVMEDGACVEEEKEEVFHIKGYTHTKDQAAGACTAHDAAVATRAQVEAAQEAEADWCSTGWVSDQTAAVYPITTTTGQGCGNGTAGIKQWTPQNNQAGVNCYGVKPAAGTEGIAPFNTTKWSRYE